MDRLRQAVRRPLGLVAMFAAYIYAHDALRLAAATVVMSFDHVGRTTAWGKHLPLDTVLSFAFLLFAISVATFAANRAWALGWKVGFVWLAAGVAYLLWLLPDYGKDKTHTILHAELYPGFYTYLPYGDIGVGENGLNTRVNNHGFRGPDFDEVPRPGVVRGVLVGDSFVFGYCLTDTETLAVRLQAHLEHHFPGVTFELLNLGIMGTSLHSYATTYDIAARHFAPDFSVLALITPGDYTRYDFEDHWRWSHSVTPYSVLGLLLGTREIYYLATLLNFVNKPPPGYEDWTRRQADRLLETRKDTGREGPMVVLSWTEAAVPLVLALADAPGVSFVSRVLKDPDDNCSPTDTHPKASSVDRVAGQLADRFAADPAFQALVARQGTAPASP